MELRHLRYFVAVGEELHFGRAARRLHLAQPPLSRQIQALEKELGVRLLERTKRHVELTPAGRVFLEHARKLLSQADDAVVAARRAARGEIGRLAVGFVGSATYSVLPELLRVFHARFPEVELVLHEMTSAHQHQALREGRIEVGFVRPAIPDEALARCVIRREPLVAALPAGHRLAQDNGPLPLSDLAGEPFILFPRDPRPSFGDLITGYCVAAGFSPRVVQETQEMQTAVSLVAAGIGVSLVPEAVRSLPRTGVTYRRLTEPPVTELTMVYRHDHPSAVLRAFLEVVEQAAAGTV